MFSQLSSGAHDLDPTDNVWGTSARGLEEGLRMLGFLMCAIQKKWIIIIIL